MLTPIPTRYKGYHFRSRLEARWAVFFDYLGLDWEYEPEGYEIWHDPIDLWEFVEDSKEPLSRKVKYLPDFVIRNVFIAGVDFGENHKSIVEVQQDIYVEVKPESFGSGKAVDFAWQTGALTFMAKGLPHWEKPFECYWKPFEDMDEAVDEWVFLRHILAVPKHNSILLVDPLPWGDPELKPPTCPDVFRAAMAARSARFEHGKSGAS